MTTAMATATLGSDRPQVPRAVRWAAKAAALTTVPSGLWRIALGLGIPVGMSDETLREGHVPGWGTVYVIVLSIVAEGLALLTLGLVRRWGEVVPRWIPLLGGRRIPTFAAAVPAALGVIALISISVSVVGNWDDDPTAGFPTGGWAVLMVACYAPLLAWGPLLAVVTVAYVIRRRRQDRMSPAG